MKSLNRHQFNKLIILCMGALKMVTLPGLMFGSVGNDIWVIYFIFFALDLFFLYILLSLKTNTNLPFIKNLENLIGKIFTKILIIIFWVFFLVKLQLILSETYYFLNYILYDHLDKFLFLICFMIIWTYLSANGLMNIGRTVEFFFYPIILCVVLACVIGLFQSDLLNVLPILKNGISPVLSTAFRYSFWLGDFVCLVFLVDKAVVEKKQIKKTMYYATFTAVVILLIVVAFIGLYNLTGHRHFTAISEIAQLPPEFSGFNRIDWITVIFFAVAQFLQSTIYFYIFYLLSTKIIRIKNKNYCLLLCNAVVVLAFVYFSIDHANIINLSRNIMSYYSLSVWSLLLLLQIALIIKNKIKKHKKFKTFTPILKKRREIKCSNF